MEVNGPNRGLSNRKGYARAYHAHAGELDYREVLRRKLRVGCNYEKFRQRYDWYAGQYDDELDLTYDQDECTE